MKKFSFSLQRLLGYKEQLLDAERAVLADMNAVLNRLIAERDDMQRQQAERCELLRQKALEGMSAIEMETHKNYLTALDFSIRQKKQQIEMQRAAIDRQTDKVREVKLEISSMEKLRERKLEEYNYTAAKEEELFIEEFVSYAKATEAGA